MSVAELGIPLGSQQQEGIHPSSHAPKETSKLSIEEALGQFKVVEFTFPSYKEIAGVLKNGFACTTHEQGEWFIIPPQNKLYEKKTPYILNGAGEALKKRQEIGRPKIEAEIKHERNLLFFSANWDTLTKLFYESELEHPHELQRFLEVDLRDFKLKRRRRSKQNRILTSGRADFVGIGPDGQVILVEFGRPNSTKEEQVQRQSLGVQEVFRKTNREDDIPCVEPFIGIYDTTSDYGQNIVRLENPGFRPRYRLATDKEVEVFNAEKHSAHHKRHS